MIPFYSYPLWTWEYHQFFLVCNIFFQKFKRRLTNFWSAKWCHPLQMWGPIKPNSRQLSIKNNITKLFAWYIGRAFFLVRYDNESPTWRPSGLVIRHWVWAVRTPYVTSHADWYDRWVSYERFVAATVGALPTQPNLTWGRIFLTRETNLSIF